MRLVGRSITVENIMMKDGNDWKFFFPPIQVLPPFEGGIYAPL